jgi:hypothetical protein
VSDRLPDFDELFEMALLVLDDDDPLRELVRLQCTSAHKSRGRPLGEKARAIREAVLGLTAEYVVMTVRQVFYALTVRGVVPKDENAGYRPVQTQVLKMRREGLLDWGFISDATRWQRKPVSYDSVEDALQATARSYRRNLWRSQNVRVEVWLEKDALAGVVMEATDPWDVALMVSRGQASDTYCYRAAEAIDDAARGGIQTVVFMLYDADKAGRVAAQKIREKLHRYSDFGISTRCEVLAVTDEQIEEWDLPTRPEKQGDGEAVELDAIPPDQLVALVEEAVESLVDADAWAKEQTAEESEREILERIAGEAPA